MYISSVEISNYKSVGDENNRLIVDKRITVLIGKNESGKSNVLDAIKGINFINGLSPNYFVNEAINRITKRPVHVTVNLEFSQDEIERFAVSEKSKFEFDKENSMVITGGIIDILRGSISYMECLDELKNMIQNTTFPQDTLARVQASINTITNVSEMHIQQYTQAINTLLPIVKRTNGERSELINRLNFIDDEVKKLVKTLPIFFYYDGKSVIKKRYAFEEFDRSAPNSIVKHNDPLLLLLEIIGETVESIRDLLNLPAGGFRSDRKREINNKIDERINKPFNNYYSQEKIVLELEIDSKSLFVHISSADGKTMDISERSEGLRWYINFFITLMYNNLPAQNVIYLIDEPGIHLHVNAQKELLRFLSSLSDNGNQIIYTTHSPFMIDANSMIRNIRALQKDERGCTQIFNNVYDAKLCKEGKAETLTPLAKAIGMELKYNIGPMSDKINIVTEGIIDYLYITAMLKYQKIDTDNICIIPSTGASEIKHVCSILFGWGFKFIALYDYDTTGIRESAELVDKLPLKVGKEVLFLIDAPNVYGEKSRSHDTVLNNPVVIESLISNKDKEYLNCVYSDQDEVSKTIRAKRFCIEIESGSYTPDKETVDNFMGLFKHLGLISG